MSETIEPTTETGTALAVIKTALPTILAADTNDILGKLADKVKSFRADISTAKGRDAIRSLAAEIASSKVTLVKLGKSLTANWREQTKAVNEECNIIEEKMDALKAQVRQPLTDFENAEKDRVAGHEAALAELISFGAIPADWPSGHISTRIEELENYPGRAWQEFDARASAAYSEVFDKLRNAHTAAIRSEVEAAELANLRAAEAERTRLAALEAQRLREEQIARDATLAAEAEAERKAQQAAAEALRAHQEAEARARAERDASAQRERDAAEALAAAERKAEQAAETARQVAARAEAARIAAHQAELETMRKLAVPLEHPDPVGVIDAKIARLVDVYNREWEEFDTEASELFAVSSEALKEYREESVHLAEEAAARKRQSDADAEAARQAAAVEAERKRAAEAKRLEDTETAKRAANRAHQAKINGDILTDLVTAMASVHEGNADEAKVIAMAIIRAVVKGEVRHVAVAY